MWHFIEDSKYKNETISIVQSFADVMLPGDSIIGIPIITVTVSTGIDPLPSTLLYGGVSIIGSSAVEQRFRLGVVGAIYLVVFTINTTFGNTFSKDCYLAILPEAGAGTPSFLSLYETSSLYPLNPFDGITSSLSILSGRLTQTVIYPIEAITTSLNITSGNMVYYAQVHYTNLPESLTTNINIISGNMVYYAQVHYNNLPENIKTNIAIISGTLTTQNNISYNDSTDAITTSLMITSGTLT